MVFYLATAIILILVCWKWGDLRNWRLYYPTILYFIIGDLTAYILLRNKPLWLYEGRPYNHFFPDLYCAIFIYPWMIILYLKHYPDRLKKQVPYILLFVTMFSAFEYILYLLGLFSYDNKWCLAYSVVFNLLMFPLLRLHFKKPLLVWPISMALAFAILFIFNIPIGSI